MKRCGKVNNSALRLSVFPTWSTNDYSMCFSFFGQTELLLLFSTASKVVSRSYFQEISYDFHTVAVNVFMSFKVLLHLLKAICEYIRKGQTSDFKLLSDAKYILSRTVRVKEVESLLKAIYFPCDYRKIVRLQNQNKL